jgi:hypothetical protein
VQVIYPGVSLEVPTGVHTITGVATSVGAFVGRAIRGPMNKAVHVLSLADDGRTRGSPHASGDLAQSVQKFLNNGCAECYVIRIAHAPLVADVTLRNLANPPANSRNVLKVTAVDPASPRFAPKFVTQSYDLVKVDTHPDRGDPSNRVVRELVPRREQIDALSPTTLRAAPTPTPRPDWLP